MLGALRIYGEPAVRRMLPLGFSSGLPLLLVYGTLSYRLREAGVDLATIGFTSWVALAYALKFAWAPLVDRVAIPGLTRRLGLRRAWLLLAQCGVIVGLIGMALADPALELTRLIGFALFTAFAAATQDIALDAYRIESAASDRQGALAAAYQTGYRIAMIWASAGALWIAARSAHGASGYQPGAWTVAYLVMAASMLIGILAVLSSRETPPAERRSGSLRWLSRVRSAVAEPFVEFFARQGRFAVLILALVSCYRISDIVMGVMANAFYVDAGFSKDEVAEVSKVYGLAMTLAGAFAGGALVARLGARRILPATAAASSASILLFAWLATRGHDLPMLIVAVTADNFAAGVAGTTFIAYLSGLTSARFTATQYALLSSVMVLVPKLLAGGSGVLVKAIGFPRFFVGAALLGVPVVVLAVLVSRLTGRASAGSPK